MNRTGSLVIIWRCVPKAAAAKMTKQEKKSISKKKTGPARKKWPVSPSGKRKK